MLPILFQIGPVKLHSYGLLLVIGFFAAAWNACREAQRRGYRPELILDLALPLLLVSVLACRLLYVALNYKQFHSLGEIFRVWDGGLSVHGAFVGAFAVLAFYAWRYKIGLATLCDLIAPSVFLGYFFGRIGCLLNGCCYGYACSLPWAMRFPDEHHPGQLTLPSHPAQLYSAIIALGLFFVMQRAKLSPRFNQFRGQLTLLFMALYAIERAVIEYFRTGVTAPSAFGIPWLTAAQVVSFVALAVIALLWVYLLRRATNKHHSDLGSQHSNVPSG